MTDATTRRVCLAALASPGILRVASAQPAAADAFPDFWDQAEPPDPSAIGVRALQDWPLWENRGRPAARWATAIVEEVDTRHLVVRPSTKPVEVTDTVFRKVLAWCGVPIPALGERVLFGIRAARLEDAGQFANGSVFRRSFTIAPYAPDHFRPGCVLGVWDPGAGTFWVCPGSTVPNVAYMFGQAEARERDVLCNMLPAGVYDYVVGTHRKRLAGAFRLDSAVAVVRRYKHPLVYTNSDEWDFRGPEIADNIHCAYQFRPGMPEFSSAGCQTIPGYPDGNRPMGLWRQFRIAAGLAPDPTVRPNPNVPDAVVSGEDGRRYRYLVLPWQDLGLAAEYASRSETDPDFRKLRRGSSGDAVRALQRQLGGSLTVSGVFDAPTQRVFIRRQGVRQGWSDGVFTHASAAALGLEGVL